MWIRRVLRSSVLFIVLFTWGCTEEESLNNNCLLEEIQFDPLNRLKIITISGGQIYEIRQEFFDSEDDRYNTVASFSFKYFTDSIAVTNSSTPGARLPYLWVNLENERPVKVTRYFYTAGVQIIFNIDYSDASKIRVNLSRLASNGNFLNAGYADYFLDDNGNVEKLVAFQVNSENREEFVKFIDQSFTYDSFTNPVKGYFLPFFNNIGIPDPRFFSNNNIATIEVGFENFDYKYDYGANNEVLSAEGPNGDVLEYSYLNCLP